MKTLTHVLSIAALALASACSNTAIETTEYLLRSARPPAAETADIHIDSLSVRVAAYLDRAGVVVETANREVRPARHHVWAEPLHESLVSVLRDEIAEALGGDVTANIAAPHRFDVEVTIDQLHGALDGRVRLVADCRVLEAGEVVNAFRFAEERTQPSEGYAAMIDTQADLVAALAEAIAAALRAAV